jgi:nitronate monooxygenase
MHPAFLNTALCQLLGIRYPIMSAGMNDCAGPELVAAVSNAGGLGSLGTGRADADYMRQEIRKVKALTDRPFAVQFPAKPLVHPHEADLPQEHVDFIDGLRTEFDVPAPARLPAPENEWWGAPSTPQSHQEVLQVILEEKVPVLVTFYGDPGGIAEQAHAHGVRVMSLVGTTRHARRCIQSGADVLIATGYDAGGHEGDIGTMALVPQVVDVAREMGRDTLVMAAGGIMDGRGLVAALALGATGISCGTAFLASPECRPFLGFIPFAKDEAPEPWYEEFIRGQLLAATEEGTSQQPVYSGGPMRALNNAYKQAWTRPGAPEALPPGMQPILVRSLLRGAYEAKRTELLANAAGQGVGMLRKVRPAAEVVAQMMREAGLIVSSMGGPAHGAGATA